MNVFLVKLVDTNGVESIDKVFTNKAEAELYVEEQEKNSKGWEMQVFEKSIEDIQNLSG